MIKQTLRGIVDVICFIIAMMLCIPLVIIIIVQSGWEWLYKND